MYISPRLRFDALPACVPQYQSFTVHFFLKRDAFIALSFILLRKEEIQSLMYQGLLCFAIIPLMQLSFQSCFLLQGSVTLGGALPNSGGGEVSIPISDSSVPFDQCGWVQNII